MVQDEIDLHPLKDVAAVIKAKRLSLATKEGYISYLKGLVLMIIVAYLAFTQVFLIIPASGTDMYPAILDGDILIGYRLDREYVKNDVLICKLDGKTVVGRVVAKGGDNVNITQEGVLYVNGTEQTGEIAFPTTPGNQTYPYTVPQGCVYLLGDFRTKTTDSRDFGPVQTSDVQAKVASIFRHRGM